MKDLVIGFFSNLIDLIKGVICIAADMNFLGMDAIMFGLNACGLKPPYYDEYVKFRKEWGIRWNAGEILTALQRPDRMLEHAVSGAHDKGVAYSIGYLIPEIVGMFIGVGEIEVAIEAIQISRLTKFLGSAEKVAELAKLVDGEAKLAKIVKSLGGAEKFVKLMEEAGGAERFFKLIDEAGGVEKFLSAVEEAGGIERYLEASKGKIIPVDEVTEIYKASIHNVESPELVLGRYPRYTEVATERGASYFSTPGEGKYSWGELVSKYGPPGPEMDAQIWKVNEKVLDEAISSGKEIILTDNPEIWLQSTGKGTFYQKELEYLRSRGYKNYINNHDGTWTITI